MLFAFLTVVITVHAYVFYSINVLNIGTESGLEETLIKMNKGHTAKERRDISVPDIAENEVLVKIRTAGMNPLDKEL